MTTDEESRLSAQSLRELESLLTDSTSLQSWNATMLGQASPSLRRHLDPARANCLRFLSLDTSLRVLEVGAEAGALTRYLGENAGYVDALEPDEKLASLARLRTRDLTNVRVITGDLDAVPSDSHYDVIVAVDGLRMASDGPSRESLVRHMLEHLAPGGSLVFAESNKFGLKSWLGSPDDITGRVFDSIEDYPSGELRGALSRKDIDALLSDAGAQPSYLLALPDHTYSRAVVRTAGLPDELRSLASDLAILPSPDLNGMRPKLADERRVWPAVVAAGMEVDLANSWLVVATLGGPSALLADDVFASFDGWQRAAKYTPHTVVRRDNTGVVFDRDYPRSSSTNALHVEDSIAPFAPGRTLLAVMAESDFEDLAPLLLRWRAAVEKTVSDRMWLDSHPGNFVVLPDGGLQAIDLEFASDEHDLDFVLRRGVVSVARDLALRRPPAAWPDTVVRIEDVAILLGESLGFNADSEWVALTLREEAEFQAEVAGERGVVVSKEERFEALRAQLETPVENLPLGSRVFDHVDGMAKDRDLAVGELGERTRELAERSAELAAAHEEQRVLSDRVDSMLAEAATALHESESTIAHLQNEAQHLAQHNDQMSQVLGSRSVRAALRMRGWAARLLPAGSRRRKIVMKLTSRGRRT